MKRILYGTIGFITNLIQIWDYLKDSSHFPAPFWGAFFGMLLFTILTFLLKFPQKVWRMFTECRFKRFCHNVLQKMNEMRTNPDFVSGSLDYILETYFKKVSNEFKERCIEKLNKDREIEAGPFGNWVFYDIKIPGNRYRGFTPYNKK